MENLVPERETVRRLISHVTDEIYLPVISIIDSKGSERSTDHQNPFCS
jgi:hypothetical protein